MRKMKSRSTENMIVYWVICLKYTFFNEYNKVKSSTVTAGYGVGVTNMIKSHRVIMKPLRGQSKAFNDVCNK